MSFETILAPHSNKASIFPGTNPTEPSILHSIKEQPRPRNDRLLKRAGARRRDLVLGVFVFYCSGYSQ